MVLDSGLKTFDFEQLVDNLMDSILVINSDFRVVYLNKACIQLLGLSSGKIGYNEVFQYIHPDYQESHRRLLCNIMENKEKTDLVDQKLVRNDGTVIDVEVLATPFAYGDTTFAQVILRDNSRRVTAEKMLGHKERLASLGQMSAGVAHEIKNPLTTVKGFLQLYKEEHEHDYLDTMQMELEKALHTIHELLRVSKPDSSEELKVPVYLARELESLLGLFQNKQYSVTIETDIRDHDQCVLGKRNLLQKAFFNLIKNALEALGEERGLVRVEHYAMDSNIFVKISDSGVGIPEDELSKVGTPFYSTKADGTGLGLTQVFTTLHEHNGTMHIDSKERMGTTILVVLPKHAAL
ncbi:ATP-binding protein [Bacillus sp. REN3]|uniref:ATP-binding protein n=1 Tax=Bacillus sp. REN3 TaxID=2802440 RepID=UPI001AEEE2AA|nr:ATP-binding protein [Bacillus sp. REN3]